MTGTSPGVCDAHVHFFSRRWFDAFAARSPLFTETDPPEAVANRLGAELPDEDPTFLADRWNDELERAGVRRAALIASLPGDGVSVRAAVDRHPERFVGMAMVDPTDPQARDTVHDLFDSGRFAGICLFPALHHFRADAGFLYPIYEEAAAFEACVFVHFGDLKIPAFRKLSIPDPVDTSFGEPSDLAQVAAEFSDVRFLVPHFGCTHHEATLELAKQRDNVFLDTSSSNAWIEPPLTLGRVYRQALEALGPERLLFGTDSSVFPRGWRRDVLDAQREALAEIGVGAADEARILGDNFDRVFRLP